MNSYPLYKEVHEDWIEKIPDTWKISSLKRFCIVKRGSSPRPIDDPKYFDENGNYSWVRISDVTSSDKYLEVTEERLSELGSSLSVKMNVGDLFLSIAGSVGKPIITKIPCCIHDGFVWFENLTINKEYLYYIFKIGQCFIGLGKMGTQLNLNTDTIGSIKIPIPSKNEQNQIVQYLDEKTEILDKLISTKERKIELLKEQRTSLINQVITKGLDLNVKMKDSGIEWIGKIPDHWETRKLKSVSDYITEKGVPSSSDVRISPENVEQSTGVCFNLYSEYENEGFKFQKGDILFNKLRVYLSKVILTSYEGYSMGEMIVVRPRNINNQFLFHIMLSYGFINSCNSFNIGVKLPRVSPDVIFNSIVPVPPIEEQNGIVEIINKNFQETSDIISLEKKKIDLLKEYRQSLISEVVTGKIDIRTYVN